MLDPHRRLYPNGAEVAAKVMDGEAVIINLTTGVYYSMDKAGGTLWSLIEDGLCAAAIAAALAARYEVAPERARADVERVVAELLADNVVVLGEAAAAPVARVNSEPRLPYEPPQLNVYRDMSDLLALDPPIPSLDHDLWKAPPDESSK